MDKPSKCKNCQWYAKPYWSIINPCDNCPNENDYKTMITIYGEPVFKETLKEEQIKKAMANKSIFEIIIEEKAKEIEQLQQKLQRKNNNWNELRKWLYEKEYSDSEYTKVLYKMEELEEK